MAPTIKRVPAATIEVYEFFPEFGGGYYRASRSRLAQWRFR